MANKRMFSVDVVETDAFLDLPPKVQALYFHLGMRKRLPSDAALWSETMDAAHRISDCYAVHANGGYAGEAKGERLEAARQIFDGLPAMVQRWAGSPRELCDLVNHNTKSELNKFTRPGFNRMLASAPLMELQPAQHADLLTAAPTAQIGDSSKPA